MRIRRQITHEGVTYKVRRCRKVDGGKSYAAVRVPAKNSETLWLEKGLSHDEAARKLFHEGVHIALPELPEKWVRKLSPTLFALLEENRMLR